MRYMREVLKKNRIMVLVYITIGIMNAFLANYKADYFQYVIDGLTSGNMVFGGIMCYGFILILNYCMNYVDEYPGKKLEYGIFLDFKLFALRKISTIDYMEYQKIGTGKLVQRIENGAEAGKNVLYEFWFCIIRQLIPTICFSIYFIWKINDMITYVILIGYVVIFIVTNILLKSLYQIKEKILNNEEKLNHFVVRGFMEMVVFRMEHQFANEMTKANKAKKEIVSSKVKMNMIHEAFFTIFALLVAILDIGILIYVWKTRSISIGSMVALISLIENAYTPIAIFNVLYVQYKLDKASYKRFENFLELKDDKQLETGKRISNMQGDISIRNLSFQYDGRIIFDNLNLSIRKGEKVALVGESGSGKTTLVKILAGLLKYTSGSIQIDGVELKEICLNDLYSQMVYLTQDSPVFDGTIRENLIFEREISDDKLMEALRRVQLSTLIQNTDKGLNAAIGERGTTLSGGEKQRLALARLWFEDKEITILDEATSAMDNLTEESVMTEVMHMLGDHTVIAVAHRLTTIANFDKIIVFNQGKVVGQGTFEELIKSNSYFIELYNASTCRR